MAFIRVKKIKGKSYAYVVENRWRKRVKGGKKGARQKVRGYLGRVYYFNRTRNIDFTNYLRIKDINGYLKKIGFSKAIIELVRLELLNHGFNEEEDNTYSKDGIIVRLDKDKFSIKGSGKGKSVIAMNEGFLCKETFNRLVNFRSRGNEREVGIKLANALVEAGLKVQDDVFVGLFGLLFEE